MVLFLVHLFQIFKQYRKQFFKNYLTIAVYGRKQFKVWEKTV